MVVKTRARSARLARSDSASNKTSPDYITILMREIIGYFQGQASIPGTISINNDVRNVIEEVVNYSMDQQHRIGKDDISELFRCFDKEAVTPQLSHDAITIVFRLFDISEQDTYREEGLKFLLRTVRYIMSGSTENAKSPTNSTIPSKRAGFINELRPVLQHSLLSERNNESTHRIIEEILNQVNKVRAVAITESPIDVSDHGANIGRKGGDSPTSNKRKRSQIPNTEEDSSVYDIPVDNVEDVLISSWSTRKANIVKFTKDGPQNQATPFKKKPRLSIGRVDNKGSPYQITKAPKAAPKRNEKVNAIPQKTDSLSRKTPKRKDLLRDVGNTATITTTIIPNITRLVNQGQQRESITQVLRSSPQATSTHNNLNGSILPQHALDFSRANRTPPSILRSSPNARSTPLKADQVDIDKYINYQDDLVIKDATLDDIFSSPIKPVFHEHDALTEGDEPIITSTEAHENLGLVRGNLELPLPQMIVIRQHIEEHPITDELPRRIRNQKVIQISSSPDQDSQKLLESTNDVDHGEVRKEKDLQSMKKVNPIPVTNDNTVQGTRVLNNNRRSIQLKAANVKQVATQTSPDLCRSLRKPRTQKLIPLELEYIGHNHAEALDEESPLRTKSTNFNLSYPPNKALPAFNCQPNLEGVAKAALLPGVATKIILEPSPCRILVAPDPDKTLVGPAVLQADMINAIPFQESFAVSSTTTGSASPPPVDEIHDNLQEVIGSIKALDDEMLAAFHPAIILLLKGYQLLSETQPKMNRFLRQHNNDVQATIDEFSRHCKSKQASCQEFLLAQIQLQKQQIEHFTTLYAHQASKVTAGNPTTCPCTRLIDKVLASLQTTSNALR